MEVRDEQKSDQPQRGGFHLRSRIMGGALLSIQPHSSPSSNCLAQVQTIERKTIGRLGQYLSAPVTPKPQSALPGAGREGPLHSVGSRAGSWAAKAALRATHSPSPRTVSSHSAHLQQPQGWQLAAPLQLRDELSQLRALLAQAGHTLPQRGQRLQLLGFQRL